MTSNSLVESLDPVLQRLCRHLGLVTVMTANATPQGGDGSDMRHWRVAPIQLVGFFVLAYGRLFWCTAGHSIKDLEKLRAGGRRVIKGRLFDAFHLPREQQTAVPVDIDRWASFAWDDRELGVDLAVFMLDAHTVRNVAANGITPITLKGFAAYKAKFDTYTMLGTPDCATRFHIIEGDRQSECFQSTGTPLLPLRRVARPRQFKKTRMNRLHFEILPNEAVTPLGRLEVKSVVGMSGGPVFGFNRVGDNLEYRLVGIQSTEHSGFTAVTPAAALRAVLRALNKRIQQSLAG